MIPLREDKTKVIVFHDKRPRSSFEENETRGNPVKKELKLPSLDESETIEKLSQQT